MKLGRQQIVTHIIKGILVIILFFSLPVPVTAQIAIDTVEVVSDTESQPMLDVRDKVDLRVPGKTMIRKYKDDVRFQYEEEEKKPPDSALFKWLVGVLGGFIEWISVLFNFKYIGWVALAIIVVILVILIFRFAKADLKTLFSKKKKDTSVTDIYTDNVHEMQFDELIRNALSEKNYRLAVRFLYFKNLKRLSDEGIILWHINKTNYSYQSEITDATLRSRFLDTTIIFDYVWYGEFPLDEDTYLLIATRMDEFYKMMGNGKN